MPLAFYSSKGDTDMENKLYHQIENTNLYEFFSKVYESEKGEHEPPHFHKNFEILTVISGKCRYCVGENEFTVCEGECIFVLPFQIHSFFLEENTSVLCTTFHEHLILSLSQTFEGKRPKDPLFRPSKEVSRFFLDQIRSLFGNDSGYIKRISPTYVRMKVKGVLYMLGSEFLAQVELTDEKRADSVVMHTVQYIAEKFKSDLSLHDVAQETGYNYQYLSRTFNKTIGINFKKLLNRFRVEYAYALLQDTDLPLGQIAFESGFQSIRSFNAVFLETFKKSPKEVRKSVKIN